MTNAKSAKYPVAVFEAPKFKVGDMVETPLGERLRVVACDLHGCTVDNGTRGGARYASDRLKLVS